MNPEVKDAIDANAMRIVSDGIPYQDLGFLIDDISGLDLWCSRWIALSERYEDLAEQAVDVGATLTAGEHLWRAALCCHFGQGILMDISAEEKLATDLRKQFLFRRAAPLLHPALERIEFSFDGDRLPGYLRLPKDQSPAPCMVIFGGLDTTKEDAFELTNYFIARNVAVLTFDGPGQGEVFHRTKMRIDYERAVSAAIDYLEKRPEVDHGRIGVLGRSTGGHWACRAAAVDSRIKVAIAWGLIYHLRHFQKLSPYLQKRFMRAASLDSLDEAVNFFLQYDLDGFGQRIQCPLLIVQGGRDTLAPEESVSFMVRDVAGLVEVIEFEDSGHCAHDRAHLSKPAMADFASRHLRK